MSSQHSCDGREAKNQCVPPTHPHTHTPHLDRLLPFLAPPRAMIHSALWVKGMNLSVLKNPLIKLGLAGRTGGKLVVGRYCHSWSQVFLVSCFQADGVRWEDECGVKGWGLPQSGNRSESFPSRRLGPQERGKVFLELLSGQRIAVIFGGPLEYQDRVCICS